MTNDDNKYIDLLVPHLIASAYNAGMNENVSSEYLIKWTRGM